LIEPENTSTVLELYTRFLKCFVSATLIRDLIRELNTDTHNRPGESASTGLHNGSIESPRNPQNAGCTMALHANCTEAKTRIILNYLFFKVFLINQMLAQSLQLSPHACHS
jgi:hypothetical protein